MKAFIFFNLKSDYGISLFGLFLVFLPLILRLFWDWYTIVKENREPDHAKHTVMTAGVMLALSFAVWGLEPIRFVWQSVLLMIGVFVMFFDYALNLMRGLNMWYVDDAEDGKGSWTDQNIYQKLPWFGTLFMKAIIFLTCFACYFFLSSIIHYPY